MNFDRTDRKIREMNQHLSSLTNSKNVDDFEGSFAAFISAARSVTLALQVDAGITFDISGSIAKKGDIKGFADWYVQKQQEMREDDMCKFFKNIRDVDLHTGDSQIQSSYTIKGGTILKAPEKGPLEINSRGTYEVYGQNTPAEKKIQKKIDGEIFQIRLYNSPNKHLGKNIDNNNPLKLCNLYKNYLEKLVFEAKEKFMNI